MTKKTIPPANIQGSNKDITSKSGRDMCASEDHFRQLAESLPQLVWTCRADGSCDYLSLQWVKYTGIPEAEQLGTGWLNQLHPDDREQTSATWNAAVGAGASFDIELRIRRNDGIYRWFSTRAIPLRDSEGRVTKWFGSNTDIEDHKRSEAALQLVRNELEERVAQRTKEWVYEHSLLRTIIDNLPFRLYAKDLQHRFILGNKTVLKEMGVPSIDALIGKTDFDFYARAMAETFLADEENIFRTGRPLLNKEDIWPLPLGSKVVSLTSKVLLRDSQTNAIIGLVGFNHDITERKRAEEALVQAKEAAEKASRAKNEFLASMSHELRTPLNPIMGFTELMEDAPNLTDEQRVWMGLIRQRGNDLLALIGAVLDLSRIEAMKMVIVREPLALRTTVQEMVASVIPAAEKKSLRLEWDVAPEAQEECLTDGLRLRQVILNLLNNALKFTITGSITVRVQDGRAARLGRPLAEDEAALLFSIQDTGIGIPADRQSAIFDAFTQADRKQAVKYGGGGAGLGLTIAQRLVELMDGKIWVESPSTSLRTGTASRGSTFFFTVIVGVNRTNAALTGAAQSTEDPGPRQALKILVVDDDLPSLMLAEIMACEAGHTARTAEDGRQALALMEAEAFDVVLMDIQMAVMDGLETTRMIREQERRSGRHTIVIALTAYAMDGDQERFLAAGMDGYMAKPLSSLKLAKALDKWLPKEKRLKI